MGVKGESDGGGNRDQRGKGGRWERRDDGDLVLHVILNANFCLVSSNESRTLLIQLQFRMKQFSISMNIQRVQLIIGRWHVFIQSCTCSVLTVLHYRYMYSHLVP